MGDAIKRGTFEQRKTAAIAAKRIKNQSQHISITEQDTIEKKCNDCNGTIFDIGYRLRIFPKISLKNPTGKDQLIELKVYTCKNCRKEIR